MDKKKTADLAVDRRSYERAALGVIEHYRRRLLAGQASKELYQATKALLVAIVNGAVSTIHGK